MNAATKQTIHGNSVHKRYTKISEHSIYLPALRTSSPCVLDLGANTGTFSHWAADFLSAKVYAVEALPELAQRLREDSRLNVLHAAVCGNSGATVIYRSPDRCASLSLNPSENANAVPVTAVTLEDVCAQWRLSEIDLVKMDIEGSELDVLSKSPISLLQSITQITCEFHDFVDASHRPRIRTICDRLDAAGFFCLPMATTTWGDTVFLNKARLDKPRLAQAEMYAYKAITGTGRVFRRMGRVFSRHNNT